MSILTYLLVAVQILCALLLLGVILIQKTKGQGGIVAFGGGMGESLFGAQMGNVLTRSTVILAIIFLTNSLVLALLGANVRHRTVGDTIEGTAPMSAPAIPGGTPAPTPGPAPVVPAPTAP